MLLLVFGLQLTVSKIAASRSQRVSAAAEQLAPPPAPAPSRSAVSSRVQRLCGSLVACSLDISASGFSAPLPCPACNCQAAEDLWTTFLEPVFHTGKRTYFTETIFNCGHSNLNILFRISLFQSAEHPTEFNFSAAALLPTNALPCKGDEHATGQMQTLVILEEMQCNAVLGQQREWMLPNLCHSPTSVAYGLRPPPLPPRHLLWPRQLYRVSPASFVARSALAVLPLRSSNIYMPSLMFSECFTHAVTLRFLPACVLGSRWGGGSRSWLRFNKGFSAIFLGNDALFATLARM
jgi:hypothetical protein